MKKIIVLFTAIAFVACSSDDDSGDVITTEFQQVETIIPQGEWIVTKLVDGQSDHTSDFESFLFNFKDDGTVVASNDLFSEPGTWAYRTSSNSGEQLVLQFSETQPFDELNDDWKINSVSSTKIELSDISGGDGDTELLTFTKS